MTLRVKVHKKSNGSQPFRLNLVVNHDGTVQLISCEDCTGTHAEVATVLRKVAGDVEKIGKGEHT